MEIEKTYPELLEMGKNARTALAEMLKLSHEQVASQKAEIAELQEELTAAKALIVKMSGHVIDMDNCEEASDEMDEFWTQLKELSLTNLGRTDS
jgi:hypothetical protein